MRLGLGAAMVLLGAGAAGGQDAPGDTAAETPSTGAARSAAQEAPDRWGFELNVALTRSSGNDRISVLVTDTKITHLQTDALKLDWTGRIRYGRSEGEDVAQNMQSALRLELGPTARWSPFVFGQAEKDPFKKLDLRTSSGAGVLYRLVRGEDAELSLSAAALHSYENLELAAADPAAQEVTHHARWRWIGQGRYAVGELVSAEHRTYYEPVWDRGGDYLMEVENTVLFQVNTRLTFRVAHVFQRNSTPPPDVEENDSLLTLGVGYRTRF